MKFTLLPPCKIKYHAFDLSVHKLAALKLLTNIFSGLELLELFDAFAERNACSLSCK